MFFEIVSNDMQLIDLIFDMFDALDEFKKMNNPDNKSGLEKRSFRAKIVFSNSFERSGRSWTRDRGLNSSFLP